MLLTLDERQERRERRGEQNRRRLGERSHRADRVDGFGAEVIAEAEAALDQDVGLGAASVAQAYGGGAQIVGRATLGGDPALPGLAPVAAIKAALAQADCQADALQTAEIMEAFAVQALLCQRQSGIDRAILNPYGGGLARGHPIGASGAVLAVNLFHRLQKTPGLGLAAIAAAGGLGTALLLRTDAP